MTNLLHVTINNQKPHRQSQRTLQLVCENGALFAWFDLYVSLCGQQHPKCSQRFVSCIHLSFTNFALFSNPTNKNITELDTKIQTAISQT